MLYAKKNLNNTQRNKYMDSGFSVRTSNSYATNCKGAENSKSFSMHFSYYIIIHFYAIFHKKSCMYIYWVCWAIKL